MPSIEARLAHLEACFGVADCTCSGPGLQVLLDDAPAAPAQACPVHGLVAMLEVRLTTRVPVPALPPPSPPNFATVDPGSGRVTVALPRPESSAPEPAPAPAPAPPAVEVLDEGNWSDRQWHAHFLRMARRRRESEEW